MVDPDDDPLKDVLARFRDRAERYASRIGHSRPGDPALTEVSALYPPDMSEWHAAVYLLSDNDGVRSEFGAVVMSGRSIGPVIEELERSRRPWASSEDAVSRWAAHFWDVDRWPGRFPYVLERLLFYRWVTVRHLRQCVPLALTILEAR